LLPLFLDSLKRIWRERKMLHYPEEAFDGKPIGISHDLGSGKKEKP